MTQSSSKKEPLLRLIEPKVFGIVALFAIFLSLGIFLAVGAEYGYFSRQFCLGAECWGEFRRLFSTPIVVLIAATNLLVAYATVAGILVAVNTYVETKRVATSQVHLANKASFESFVTSRLDRLRYVDSKIVSMDIWYGCVYPGSHKGDLSIGPAYLEHLDKIREIVRRTNGFIRQAGRGYRHDRYQGPIIEQLRGFGINLAGTSRLEFFSLEREIYALINDVNLVFCPDTKCESLVPSIAHGIP